MKLWTKSSIQICQERSFRGAGAFLFDSVELGDGMGVGDNCSTVGDGEGEGSGDGEATTSGGDVCCGVGNGVAGILVSLLFCDRNAQSAIRIAIAKTTAPIRNGFHFGADFLSSTGARWFSATSVGGFSPSTDCSSNSLIAEATAGMCFEKG